MKAILVGIRIKKEEDDFDSSMQECESLCNADGIEVVCTMSQSSNTLDPSTALRKGKCIELENLIKELDVEVVVFNNNLGTKVVSNLKEKLEVEVLDRTSLILKIFEERAFSKEAKLQTAIAKLKYDYPMQLKESGDLDSQRGGSFNNRGAGEKRGSLIKRNVASKIVELKKELKKLEDRKEVEYSKRERSAIKKVALVGYTNAGKSSLMNAFLELSDKKEKGVLEKDQLFATLDTSVRKIRVQKIEFLLLDTVGFVSDLPHELVEAFRSTLKAARDADLLLNVVDISKKDYEKDIEVTRNTLKEIGASDIKILHVYNKVDLLKEKREDLLCISCKTKEGFPQLIEKIEECLYPKEHQEEILIPYPRIFLLNEYSRLARFEWIENKEEGSVYRIFSTKEMMNQIKNRLHM